MKNPSRLLRDPVFDRDRAQVAACLSIPFHPRGWRPRFALRPPSRPTDPRRGYPCDRIFLPAISRSCFTRRISFLNSEGERNRSRIRGIENSWEARR